MVALSALACLFFLFIPDACWAEKTALPPERAAGIFAMLRDGAGKLTEIETAFRQETVIPEAGAVISVRGTFSALSGTVRLESHAPVRAGLVLTDTGFESWAVVDGKPEKRPFRTHARAGEALRFLLACLFFDEEALRRHWALDVRGAEPPVVRLTALNDMIHAYITAMDLAFSADGKALRSLRALSPRNGDTTFFFGESASGKSGTGPGKLFTAVYTERAKRLPLLLYVWDEGGKTGGTTHCVAFAEILLFRLGRVTVTPREIAAISTYYDSQTDRILERVGEALRRRGGERRYKGEGWVLDIVPADEGG